MEDQLTALHNKPSHGTHSVTDAEVHRVTAGEGAQNVLSGRRATERRCNAWPQTIGLAYARSTMRTTWL